MAVKIRVRLGLPLLDEVLETGKVTVPPDLKGTYIEECTAPAYEALGPFIKNLADKTFSDTQEVDEALGQWEKIAKQKMLTKDFRRMGRSGSIIAILTHGMGGDLEIATVEKA